MRANAFLRTKLLLVCLCVFFTLSCKPRRSGGSSATSAGAPEYFGGTSMSDDACVEDPSKCNCTLHNEYDKSRWETNASLSEEQKASYRRNWFQQCIGQEIWYKATGGSGRFHAYFQPQKLNAIGDWGLVLHSENRPQRFNNWGLVNDPSCCVPGKTCNQEPYKSHYDYLQIPTYGPNGEATTKPFAELTVDDTYGFDFCPGDEKLLGFIGKPGMDYTTADPACNISKLEAKLNFKIRIEGKDSSLERSDSCFLEFGTSTGAVGFRKFPNPRFNRAKWLALNGNLSTWENYSYREVGGNGLPNYKNNKGGKLRVNDGSVEPPFWVGETCGSCHVGFNPNNPPADPGDPKWSNILVAIGNTYLHMSEILAAGSPPDTIEHELFLYARPGTVDTSAVTNDNVNNPGTFNAIINFDRRPGVQNDPNDPQFAGKVGATLGRFHENVTTFFQQGDGTYKKESRANHHIPHVLKGGEDSIGAQGAVQRVYINIFSCTEACLGNHLDDIRSFSGRGSRQTPYELDQCRRDCPSYAAIEDRVWDVVDFLLRVRPNDLENSKDPPGPDAVDGKQIVEEIRKKDGGAWLAAGRQVFANKCAVCHSSHPGQGDQAGTYNKVQNKMNDISAGTFVSMSEERNPEGVRLEWFGSDVQIPSLMVGTNRCRSLHQNHMEGHLWDAFASADYRSPARYAGLKPEVSNFPQERLGANNLGGRGFYRNISLMNVWAHAPFMHNNGIGPEWDHPMFFPGRGAADTPEARWKSIAPSPSVKTRLAMFEESMESLLSDPDKRQSTTVVRRSLGGQVLGTKKYDYKVAVTAAPIILGVMPVFPEIPDWVPQSLSAVASKLKNMVIRFPAGMPITVIGSLRHKQIIADLMALVAAQSSYPGKISAAEQFIAGIVGQDPLNTDPDVIARNLEAKGYLNCADTAENRGHNFKVSDTEKAQLIDYLKTL